MQTLDPVCKMEIESSTAVEQTTHNDVTYFFCMQGCKDAFLADPKKYLPKKGLLERFRR